MKKLSLLVLALGLLSGCASDSTQNQIPADYVEAGTVTPHGVAAVKQELFKVGIVAYTDSSAYPQPYRILVAPKNKAEAAAIIADFKNRPLSVGY